MRHTLSIALLALTPLLCLAGIDDTMTDVKNFAKPFGAISISLESAGKVVLTRTAAGADAGVDWQIEGKHSVPLDADHDRIKLTPAGSVNDGKYMVTILFFSADGKFLGEEPWIGASSRADVQELASVSALAKESKLEQPAGYLLRFRVLPAEKKDIGYAFSRIEIGKADPK